MNLSPYRIVKNIFVCTSNTEDLVMDKNCQPSDPLLYLEICCEGPSIFIPTGMKGVLYGKYLRKSRV